MTDLTEATHAGYRGDMDYRAGMYASSPDWCGYVAGMAHRLCGGQYPAKASMGRGYKVNVGSKSYDAYGPICAAARMTLIASSRATFAASERAL